MPKRRQTRTRRLRGWALSPPSEGADGAWPPSRPLSAPAWPLTTRGSARKYLAGPELEGTAKPGGEDTAERGWGGGIALAAA
jgi:hypothetical protein